MKNFQSVDPLDPLKVYIEPSPCPKASVDLEKIASLLNLSGMEITETPDGSTVALVFGCGFIDDAKLDTIDSLLGLAELKRAGRLNHILLVGCLPQKYGEELVSELPEVDGFVGVEWLGWIANIVRDVVAGKSQRLWKSCLDPRDLPLGRSLLSPDYWTRWVMICDGCDNNCSYCSIPQMRGRLRSRSPQEIIEEVDLLAKQGAREIVLGGQDTASYGKDTNQSNLVDIVSRIARSFPDIWIRIAYANPDNLDASIASVISEYPNVCNYLDIPIQHASPKILKAMNRKDDCERLRYLVSTLRRYVPDISLRTSVIVGFPGETEDDFQVLRRFLIEMRFDLVGVFEFSPQPGTPAEKLPDQVPDEVKHQRLIEIVGTQELLARLCMRKIVGKTVKVLVEGHDGKRGWGRSQYDMKDVDRIIRIDGCPETSVGEFGNVRIDSIIDSYEWIGKWI